jgi:hypothetical protein
MPDFFNPQTPAPRKISYTMLASIFGLACVPSRAASGRCKFSADEDANWKTLVLQYGERNWKRISSVMNNRTTRQCRERYKNYLSTDLSVRPWSDAEDEILTQKVLELGQKWAQISRFFSSRSDVRLKNYWLAIAGRGYGVRDNSESALHSPDDVRFAPSPVHRPERPGGLCDQEVRAPAEARSHPRRAAWIYDRAIAVEGLRRGY